MLYRNFWPLKLKKKHLNVLGPLNDKRFWYSGARGC